MEYKHEWRALGRPHTTVHVALSKWADHTRNAEDLRIPVGAMAERMPMLSPTVDQSPADEHGLADQEYARLQLRT